MQVESEAIREINYDAERAKLFVTFNDGDLYVYVGVPGEVHRSFWTRTPKAGSSPMKSATSIRTTRWTAKPSYFIR